MATPVAPEALAQIPVEARGKVCICPLCAQPRPVPDTREGVAAGPAPI
jgi:hypothetical protein